MDSTTDYLVSTLTCTVVYQSVYANSDYGSDRHLRFEENSVLCISTAVLPITWGIAALMQEYHFSDRKRIWTFSLANFKTTQRPLLPILLLKP